MDLPLFFLAFWYASGATVLGLGELIKGLGIQEVGIDALLYVAVLISRSWRSLCIVESKVSLNPEKGILVGGFWLLITLLDLISLLLLDRKLSCKFFALYRGLF
jgi:hypothetical protein